MQDLPTGWVAHVAAKNGRVFFTHCESGHTQQEVPPGASIRTFFLFRARIIHLKIPVFFCFCFASTSAPLHSSLFFFILLGPPTWLSVVVVHTGYADAQEEPAVGKVGNGTANDLGGPILPPATFAELQAGTRGMLLEVDEGFEARNELLQRKMMEEEGLTEQEITEKLQPLGPSRTNTLHGAGAQQDLNGSAGSGQRHDNVICDGCNTPVYGVSLLINARPSTPASG